MTMPRVDVTVSGLSLAADPPFPVGVSADSRYLVDQYDDPWFGVGDTAWSLCAQLGPTDVDTYLEDRAAKGVNFVLANVLDKAFGLNVPNNYNDDPPFTGTLFQSAVGDAYFDHVEYIVGKAESLGITLLLCPAYLGINNTEGFCDDVSAASNANMTTYGEALAGRLGGFQNIIWLIGHDKVPDSTEKARQEALNAALPAGHLRCLGTNPNSGGTILGAPPWGTTTVSADLETIYSYDQTGADDGAEAWAASPTMPFIFFEGIYEQEQSIGIGAAVLRWQMYAPTMAGASGVIFGNNPIWHFDAPDPVYPSYTGTWEANLDFEGSEHLAIFADFMASYDWSSLAPDTGDTFLTSGESTGTSRAAARFSDQLGLVYMPTSRSINLDLTEMAAGSALVRKFDPTDGSYTTVGTYATSGTQTISAPGTNAGGDSDWVIVVTPA